jgi:hypothetical protein
MIKPDMIPDEVVEALHTSLADDAGVLVPKGDCVTAIAAALNAWPGGAGKRDDIRQNQNAYLYPPPAAGGPR